MVQTKQMTDFVCEGGLEIVRAGRAVGGELQLRAIIGSWSRIDTDICFGDVARFGIEKDASPCSSRVGIEGFIFNRVGDCQQIDSIGCFYRPYGEERRP